MFDGCQQSVGGVGPKCADVAEKIVQLFGWRQTYKVEKLQRSVPDRATMRISITRSYELKDRKHSLDSRVRRQLLGSDSWVAVRNLQSSGGGILDPDDRVSSVADDRETIVASFEDGDGAHHAGGDGASGSSVGTASPELLYDSEKYPPYTDIEITSSQILSPLPLALQVRRGSEPNLNQLAPPVSPPKPPDPSKRWSAAIAPGQDPLEKKNGYDCEENDEERGRITREGSNRLSMQFLGDNAGGYRWAEAAEKAASSASKVRPNGSTSLPRDHRRKEPLGQANNSNSPVQNVPSSLDNRLSPHNFNNSEETIDLIIIRNEPGPLGIHVVPDYDRLGKDRGLVVQGIEPGGRIDRDGKLAIYDRIIEINGQNLLNQPFQRVQEIFKLSLIATELRLKVIKNKLSEQQRKTPIPVYSSPGQRRLPENKENVAMVEAEQQLSTDTKVATVSPTKKIPGGTRNLKSLLTANTRKIGKKIELQLTKGVHGLGFSITTRDNPAGGNCPIYIKNILPKGAAVEDGRLKPGDRLLEVNGVEMTGKSQAEAVSVLRNAPPGSNVRIIVSRQEDVAGPNLPREIGADGIEGVLPTVGDVPPAIPPLPSPHHLTKGSVAKIVSHFQDAVKANIHEKSDDSLVFPWKHREILTFDIPVHDTEKAGLGVSVKGKTTQSANGSGSADLGIFIKSVLHGGAASRDRRLRTNDQLLNVNGISLLHQSNSEAMETLRRAMLHTEGPVKGSITLTIARRANSPALNTTNDKLSVSGYFNNNSGSETISTVTTESENSATDNSGASEGSGNTVIFLPYKQGECTTAPFNNSPISKGINPSWNPVIDRITGQSKNPNAQLRNESYYMATHDTWSTSMLMGGKSDKLTSPTVNLPSGETVIIEEEYPSNVPQNTRLRLADGAIENRNDIQPDGKASSANDKTNESTLSTPNDPTYSSQLSLENPAGFSRDAFGRQSMSEKRHATLDAKNTGTYQRNKKLREEREKTKPRDDADKLGDLGPSLGMKKSSSLESLQTMVQEIQMQEEGDPAYSYRGGQGALKVIRGRGCDESFRAAVDVDYDKHLVDPDHRSETSPKKHWLLDPPANRSAEGPNEREIDGFSNVRGGIRQSSLNAVLDSKHKHGKKKPGILRGIGSMFRFGKHRKMDLEQLPEPEFEENPTQEQKDQAVNKEIEKHQEELIKSIPLQKVEDENKNPEPMYYFSQFQPHPQNINRSQQENKSQEVQYQQFAKYQQNRQLEDQKNRNQEGYYGQFQGHHESPRNKPQYQQQFSQFSPHQQQYRQRQRPDHPAMIPEGAMAPQVRYRDPENSNRSEKVHNLRAQHQQRHVDRQGHYPNDEREEHYEEIIRQRLEQGGPSYEPFREMGRPGSRSGIIDPVRFNHYVNYDELQHHISRKQHQYHSQRQPRSEVHQRPVSNFYEYESVQSLIQGRGRTLIQTPPQQNGDLNSNSLPRNQPVVGRQVYNQQSRPYQQHTPPYHRFQGHPRSQGHTVNGKVRGPFVTHVTIGTDNKNAGSKV